MKLVDTGYWRVLLTKVIPSVLRPFTEGLSKILRWGIIHSLVALPYQGENHGRETKPEGFGFWNGSECWHHTTGSGACNQGA